MLNIVNNWICQHPIASTLLTIFGLFHIYTFIYEFIWIDQKSAQEHWNRQKSREFFAYLFEQAMRKRYYEQYGYLPEDRYRYITPEEQQIQQELNRKIKEIFAKAAQKK